jgi:hypothetical protein
VVYETTGSTLAISGTTGNVCERGKAVVIGTGTTIPTLPDNLTQYTFE